MFVKLWWYTLLPEHVDHFVLVFVCYFSVHRKQILILRSEQVDIKIEIFVIKIFLVNSNMSNVGQKISRFNSCGSVLFSCTFFLADYYPERNLFADSCTPICSRLSGRLTVVSLPKLLSLVR